MNAPATARRLPLLTEAPVPRRPEVRGLCGQTPTVPCGWVSCRYHAVHLRWSPEELAAQRSNTVIAYIRALGPDSCVLDCADAGEHTEEEIASICNVTQSGVSQTLTTAYERIGALIDRDGEFVQRALFGLAKARRKERRRPRVRPETAPVSQLVLFPE
jgi:hypothetical protein